MTPRPRGAKSSTPVDASGPIGALTLAEDREKAAPPQASAQIAAWVNEGGAGGEVKR
jgi:hypothetical protein